MAKTSTNMARALRQTSTWAEKRLWRHLRNRKMCGQKFRRQQPFGNYILDFYCPEKRLAIELDGSGHGEAEQEEHDKERDEFFAKEGIKTIRIWNSRLRENLDGVLEMIRLELEK